MRLVLFLALLLLVAGCSDESSDRKTPADPLFKIDPSLSMLKMTSEGGELSYCVLSKMSSDNTNDEEG